MPKPKQLPVVIIPAQPGFALVACSDATRAPIKHPVVAWAVRPTKDDEGTTWGRAQPVCHIPFEDADYDGLLCPDGRS